jgi:hypothetical protein
VAIAAVAIVPAVSTVVIKAAMVAAPMMVTATPMVTDQNAPWIAQVTSVKRTARREWMRRHIGVAASRGGRDHRYR